MSIKNKKLLYHLTSLDNLDSILKWGLLSRDEIDYFDNIADPDIIDFRKKNNLTKYVPFHFFADNPFDGIVQKKSPSKEFIYICLFREFAQKNDFRIIPKHPIAMTPLILYNYLNGYEIIEWEIMNNRDYSDRNCKHICMAECLSPKTISPISFSQIFVRTEKVKQIVEAECSKILNTSFDFHTNVNSNMFVE